MICIPVNVMNYYSDNEYNIDMIKLLYSSNCSMLTILEDSDSIRSNWRLMNGEMRPIILDL